jgi:CBS domain containing-hemolysin-like protein
VPVYGETPDDIVGVLDVAAFLRAPTEHFTERLDLPSFVPETMKALTLLKRFLTHPQSLAIVVDEHGGVEGVVTLADLVEEIISDAVPQADRRLYMESLGDGRIVASGSARLEDVGEELGMIIEQGGIDTIGGLVFNHVGQVPKPGTELRLHGLRIVIRRATRRRVEEVIVQCDETKAEDRP